VAPPTRERRGERDRAREATIAFALKRAAYLLPYFAGWLWAVGAVVRAGERLATFIAEGSKRRKRSGLETPSLRMHRGQSLAEAATVALKLLSHRSQ
jgi:hypothetical protein